MPLQEEDYNDETTMIEDNNNDDNIDDDDDDKDETTVMDQSLTLELSMSRLHIEMSPRPCNKKEHVNSPRTSIYNHREENDKHQNEQKEKYDDDVEVEEEKEWKQKYCCESNANNDDMKDDLSIDHNKTVTSMQNSDHNNDHHRHHDFYFNSQCHQSSDDNSTRVCKRNNNNHEINTDSKNQQEHQYYEQLYLQSYKDLIFGIISKHGNDQNDIDIENESNCIENTANTITIDERIKNLYQRLESEGVNNLLSRVSVCVRMQSDNKDEDIKDDFIGDSNDHMYYQRRGGTNRKNDDISLSHHLDHEILTNNSFEMNGFNQRERVHEYHHHWRNDESCKNNTDLPSRSANDSDDSTVSSIELVRNSKNQCNLQNQHDERGGRNNSISSMNSTFQSPDVNIRKSTKKRMASTSGRKGTDLQRMKISLREEQKQQQHEQDDSFDVYNNNHYDHGSDDGGFEHLNNEYYDEDDDDQFTQHKVDGIMNATTYYDPISSPINDDIGGHMSFLDNALHSQSPIPRRKNLQSPTIEESCIGDMDILSSCHNSIPGQRRKKSNKIKKNQSILHTQYQHQLQRQQSKDYILLGGNTMDDKDLGMNDSIESVESQLMEQSNDDDEDKGGHESYIHDDIDNSEEDGGNHRSASLRKDFNFYLDPLKVYRPPQKTTSYYAKQQRLSRKPNGGKKKRKDQSKNPVNVRRMRKDIIKEASLLPTCTFVDEPFKQFGTRAADRLAIVLEWLLDKDVRIESSQHNRNERLSDSSGEGRGIVVSIPLKQIMIIAICTIFKNGVHHIPRSSRPTFENGQCRSSVIQSNSPIYGGTLIVVKSKEETIEWLNILREKTSFSVLNHCEITSTERRRTRLSVKCASYDIVLTTYDALKTKEVTTYLDGKGRAIRQDNSQEGEWISSGRMNSNSLEESQRTSKILSRLHCIEWTRVLFMDTLGRLSYLTKPGTARLDAAIALVARSRLIFFIKPPDDITCIEDPYYFEDKLKESRRQLLPLAQILDLPENRTGDQLVGQAMIDLRYVNDSQHLESESSCGESLFEECSLSEDIDSGSDD